MTTGSPTHLDRPLIGISAYEEEAAWGVWRTAAVVLPLHYIRAVTSAGGVPIVLPVQNGGAAALVRPLDGLVLTGGPDVDPERYGERRGLETDQPRRSRDDFEAELLGEASRLALPVLAICRGMQLLNVARGGTLVQHLPATTGTDAHRPSPGNFAQQHVEVDPTSRVAAVLGAVEVDVACHHHQAIARLGEGLQAVARSSDGVIEAVEDPSIPFLLGVQWHPEVEDDPKLFRALVEAARLAATGGA